MYSTASAGADVSDTGIDARSHCTVHKKPVIIHACITDAPAYFHILIIFVVPNYNVLNAAESSFRAPSFYLLILSQ